MSGWLAVFVLAGTLLASIAGGLSVAALTGRPRRWCVLAAATAATGLLAAIAWTIPGLANDVGSAIVALVFAGAGPDTVLERVAAVGWGALGRVAGLLDWWRGLVDTAAWRSMGYIVVPLAIVVLPVFLWRITKLHVDD